MDSSFTIRPRDTTARTSVERRNSVRTDVAAARSVSAASHSHPVAPAQPDALPHERALDPQCQAVLDREREERERRQARKDEALLRQKAYGRYAVQQSEPREDTEPHADLAI